MRKDLYSFRKAFQKIRYAETRNNEMKRRRRIGDDEEMVTGQRRRWRNAETTLARCGDDDGVDGETTTESQRR
ncbi:hypothetical protein IGI04_034876 [Brassica rapa subsp. trilocularis]|uniref:Uncharacterized protein n=1 Tax=Brassica rapa subsp. trilocularis TaxID=1813537 RepID=A0ABQ7LDV7_BRACM|nr:hypothetical protein IGI04_034876 [Brassica rapa subsp. trilocularis]